MTKTGRKRRKKKPPVESEIHAIVEVPRPLKDAILGWFEQNGSTEFLFYPAVDVATETGAVLADTTAACAHLFSVGELVRDAGRYRMAER